MDIKIRILIAEDHQTVREGIKLLVDAQPDMEIIGEADNGEIAVEMVKQLDPDLILMDVSMPVMNGLVATRKLRKLYKDLKILTLSRHTDDGYLRQLISAGANGYVLKQSAPAELINAIRAVGHGKSFLDPNLTHRVMDGYVSRTESLRGENKGDLSLREEDVLRLIALGFSNKEIASQCGLSVKTVEAHKSNAVRKLGINGRFGIVKYAILRNWLQDD